MALTRPTSLMDGDDATQLTLVLRRALGQDVTLGCVATLYAAALADFQALGSGLLVFIWA